MHLLLHPSAWSDRADDEAENDILAMQVPICRTAIMWTGNKYFLICFNFFVHLSAKESNV